MLFFYGCFYYYMGIILSTMSYHRLNEKVTENVNIVLFNYSRKHVVLPFFVATLELQKKAFSSLFTGKVSVKGPLDRF